jgi:hypothetical protein
MLAIAELARDCRRVSSALAVCTWLQVAAMMNADVQASCGAKGKHDPARSAVRHGSEAGSVTGTTDLAEPTRQTSHGHRLEPRTSGVRNESARAQEHPPRRANS